MNKQELIEKWETAFDMWESDSLNEKLSDQKRNIAHSKACEIRCFINDVKELNTQSHPEPEKKTADDTLWDNLDTPTRNAIIKLNAWSWIIKAIHEYASQGIELPSDDKEKCHHPKLSITTGKKIHKCPNCGEYISLND